MKSEAFSSTAHRYARKDWSDEKNKSVYGDFFSREGLGHNFRLVLELNSEVESANPALDLVRKIDHKFLDENEAYFSGRVSSLENITEFLFAEALKLWPKVLVNIEVFEGETLSCLRTMKGLALKKLYRTRSSETVYDVEIMFGGAIDPESGLILARPYIKDIEQQHLSTITQAVLGGLLLGPDQTLFTSNTIASRCAIISVDVRNALDKSLIKSLRLLD